MDAAEISKILNEWASALKIDEEGKRRRFSLRDLIKKYSQDVPAVGGRRMISVTTIFLFVRIR
jgi:hypothetical protein